MARNEGGKMKLRNKKTGEIIEKYPDRFVINSGEQIRQYDSLAELNEEWEDYKELEYWYIDDNGDILLSDLDDDELWKDLAEQRKQIGNYFESKEEAELAICKLKAWKRLNNCGLKFIDWWLSRDNHIIIGTNRQIFDIDEQGLRIDDLDLLFGGEE